MASISLKALVDKESNKVIFIESDNDLVDVIFGFLTIPLGTIVKLSDKKSVPLQIGCMNNLYAGVANMDVQHFKTEAFRDMLLCPQNGAEYLCKNLKVKIADYVPQGYFLCESWHCTFFENNLLSHYKGDRCECGRCMKISCVLTGPSSADKEDGGVFLKRSPRLMITDDLHVVSPLSAATCSLIKKLGVVNESTKIEELTFNVGVNEVKELLMRSLVSKSPFTEILLRQKHEKLSSENLYQQIYIGSQMSGELMNENEEKISVKLTVSKSKNIVCYAEAGEDFVNLLFSFLTLPLGVISKHLQDVTSHGCIDHLSKSAFDLDDKYLKSNHHKEILMGSQTSPGFCYENYPLGTADCPVPPYYYAYWTEGGLYDRLTADKTLIPSNAATVPLILKNNKSHQGYLKGAAMFTVTDKLIIRPVSPLLRFSVLNELKVPLTDIKEEIVQVGKMEALRLLIASFVGDSALTDVFIRQLKKEQCRDIVSSSDTSTVTNSASETPNLKVNANTMPPMESGPSAAETKLKLEPSISSLHTVEISTGLASQSSLGNASPAPALAPESQPSFKNTASPAPAVEPESQPSFKNTASPAPAVAPERQPSFKNIASHAPAVAPESQNTQVECPKYTGLDVQNTQEDDTSMNAQAPTPSGFGQPTQVGPGQQALRSVLGAFGQPRQIGTGLPGTSFGSPSGFGGSIAGTNSPGGFSGAATGGFAGATSTVGGFAAVSSGSGGFASFASGGGGFGGAASGGGAGGGGFGGAAPTGTGFPGANVAGGGFGAFGGEQLFTQMRK